MSNVPIRDMTQSGTPDASSLLVFDNGVMRKGTFGSAADAIRPVASQSEAEAGADNAKTMTPLRAKQSIASEVGVTLASKAQGDLANTALQPAAIGTTVQAHDGDLDTIAGLSPSNDDLLQRKAGAWANRSLAQVKTDLALNNVDNTSDANKPVSTAQAAADALVASNAASALATGLADKVVGPASVTDDLPAIFDGTTGKLIKSKTYSAFKTLLALVKGDVGLGNVDNTSDANKPVSTAQATAIALKADIASPTLTGVPAAPTATPGTNTTQLATTQFVTAAVAAATAGVSSLNGRTGALVIYAPPQGRLTLTTGTPVMTSTAAGQTTVYYTPACGDMVPIYDGSNIVPTVFAELSQLTTDTTKSPAAVTTNSNYDVFVWNDSGTLRATRGPAWSSSTTRGTGAGTTELVRVKGLYFNANSITNGPAAQRGTYVGTIRSNGTSTIDWILGASGAGGTAAVLGVWNAYNRQVVATTVTDSNASWNYTSATVRQVDGSGGNQVGFISGLAADGITASYAGGGSLAAAAGAFYQIGLALDSVTVFDKNNVFQTGSAVAVTGGSFVTNNYAPQIGYHLIAALERSDGTNAVTFVGGTRSGLTVQVMA